MPASTTRPDEGYRYTDKTTGREKVFTAKGDEAMVRLRPSATTDDLTAVVASPDLSSVSQGYNLERGFAAVYVTAGSDAQAASESLRGQDAVRDAMPVMVDENGASRYFLPDELTVQFRDGVDDAAARRIVQEHASHVVAEQRTPGYYTIAVPAGSDVFAAVRDFEALDEVAFAEPSEVGFNDALYLPDDPDFPRLWGLRNLGQTVNGTTGTADADIRASQAWDLTRGDPDVVLVVIDTGADLDHPDLQANLLPRGSEDWDFAAGDSVPEDEDFHGTHVAGTAVGVDNTVGVIGVAPACRLMPLRINLTAGMNQNRADAINYVAAQAQAHPDLRYVVNCSWRTSGDHAGIRSAIQNAVAHNVVVVFAAGNANANTDVTPQFPGVYPEVISVAALDQSDRRAGFSNFGSTVDVAAPGVNVWSSMPGGTYGFLDGTSMASPHVAGVVALTWSRNKNLSNAQVRQIVESTCDSVDALNPGVAGLLGAGRVNALRAVTSPLLFPFAESRTADLTGDGRADIVGFGDHGVWVSLNQGTGTFSAPSLAVANFAYVAGGWRIEKHPRMLADLTGDGRADIVGFGDAGVWVCRNQGNGTFGAPQFVLAGFAPGAGGWLVERHPRFLADLTGDGRADIVGFGEGGVWTALNQGNGTFAAPQFVLAGFAPLAGGWRVDRHPRYVVDLTGDGRADLVGFGDGGVWVALGQGNGTFAQPQFVVGDLGYNQGWRIDLHPRLLADVTGDGRPDIVGFGDAGVWVALNQGNGTFKPAQFAYGDFGTAQGWRVWKHPRFVADVTGTGRGDLVGFGDAGVYVARSHGDGTFGVLERVVDNFAQEAGGWRVDKHPRFVADLTGDRRSDIVGFGDAGVWVSLAAANNRFTPPTKVIDNFAYVAGAWRVDKHPRFVVGPR